jgi:hypothetical protein
MKTRYTVTRRGTCLVESGISNFEEIDATGNTIAGNVRHVDRVRAKAINKATTIID